MFSGNAVTKEIYVIARALHIFIFFFTFLYIVIDINFGINKFTIDRVYQVII